MERVASERRRMVRAAMNAIAMASRVSTAAAARIAVIDAVSADVRVDGIAGSREVSIDSVSGDVRLALEAQRLKVSSVSGDVVADGRVARSATKGILPAFAHPSRAQLEIQFS